MDQFETDLADAGTAARVMALVCIPTSWARRTG